MNSVHILGRLGQDPELRHTPSGTAVSNFSLAIKEAWTDKQGHKQERTHWLKVVTWGKTAELCSKYLGKGKRAAITGSIKTETFEGKDGQKRYSTFIQADRVEFIDFKDDNSKNDSSSDSQADFENSVANNSEFNLSDATFTSEDIPF